MWRGFGESRDGRVDGGGSVREFVKWVRRVWRWEVFVRRVVLSDILGGVVRFVYVVCEVKYFGVGVLAEDFFGGCGLCHCRDLRCLLLTSVVCLLQPSPPNRISCLNTGGRLILSPSSTYECDW